VTVLFCDLVDSTRLSRQLDPEDYRTVIRAYQETVVAAIQPFDSDVAQYLGDGLLLYFGWPQAHEDAALRAVHASLAILDALEPLNTHLEPQHGMRVAVRLGLHTGLAVIGAMGSGTRQEALAMGDTPNIAAPHPRAGRAQYGGAQRYDGTPSARGLCAGGLGHPSPQGSDGADAGLPPQDALTWRRKQKPWVAINLHLRHLTSASQSNVFALTKAPRHFKVFASWFHTSRAGEVQQNAYTIARAGGRHAGLLRTYERKSTAEIQRALRSYERQVELHRQKIHSPEQFVQDWSTLRSHVQSGLLRHWQEDVVCNQELAEIMRGLLRERCWVVKDDKKFEHYLFDLGRLVREYALAAVEERQKQEDTASLEFYEGYI
jgi:hypothetical protein